MTRVVCLVCGYRWLATDPGVLYRSADQRWWCADEIACAERVTMRAGLAKAWTGLWKAMGWQT